MSLKLSVDVRALDALVRDLKDADKVLGRAQYRAVNQVASKAYTRSRREIASRVNLKQDYIKGRMSLVKATQDRAVAIIRARIRATRLATYAAKQLTAAAPRARGDALRGIPAGRKQSGVQVGVKKGSRKTLRGAFLLPLRAGKLDGGNGMGVFTRTGRGRNAIKHAYGPSVDQVFRGVIRDIEKDIGAELSEVILKKTEYEVRKALKLL